MKKNKILKCLVIIATLIYVVVIFVKQQKTLNQYSSNCKELEIQIEEQKEYKEELSKKKEDINSNEYIEEAARENLDMYLPNEKVYIDTGY